MTGGGATMEGPEQGKLSALWARVLARKTQWLVALVVGLVIVVAARAADRNGNDARALVAPVAPSAPASNSAETVVPSTAATTPVPKGIPRQNALAHVGESVTIVGPVAGTAYAKSSKGSPTFLNIGVDYPDNSRFTVVIWDDDRGRFSSPPEDMYAGKSIAVTGVVEIYQGRAEIIVSSPDQIQVY